MTDGRAGTIKCMLYEWKIRYEYICGTCVVISIGQLHALCYISSQVKIYRNQTQYMKYKIARKFAASKFHYQLCTFSLCRDLVTLMMIKLSDGIIAWKTSAVNEMMKNPITQLQRKWIATFAQWCLTKWLPLCKSHLRSMILWYFDNDGKNGVGSDTI